MPTAFADPAGLPAAKAATPSASPAAAAPAAIPAPLLPLLAASGLKPLTLAGRQLLPIVQGGMGVGVSAHRLAGAVAAQGGVGTLSAVDLRRHHPDLMARTAGLALRVGCDADTKAQIDAANLEAVEREVRAARNAAGGRGLIAMRWGLLMADSKGSGPAC